MSAGAQFLGGGPHPFALDLVPDERRERRLLDGPQVGAAGDAAFGEETIDDAELLGATRTRLSDGPDGMQRHRVTAPEQCWPERRQGALDQSQIHLNSGVLRYQRFIL